MAQTDHERILELEADNAALRRAIALLHRIANLSRESLELWPVCYAALTGVTAGVGLGFNRAMLFFGDALASDAASTEATREVACLHGAAAVGPLDRNHADRVWKSIEAEEPDLHTLYVSGVRAGQQAGDDVHALDQRVRGVVVDPLGASRVALAYRRLEVVTEGGDDDLGGLLDPVTGIAAPLRGRLGVHGVLYADNRFTGHPIDGLTGLVFGMVADHAARAIENARHYEDMARAARTDPLTGLGHHGALMDALTSAVLEAQHAGTPLSIAMIDLDGFKAINDAHGHPLGDRLLVEVAERLRRSARGGEVFRYGGEEFSVLLPGAGLDDAAHAAERLRLSVCEAPFDLGGDRLLAATCSLGVATLVAGRGVAELVQAADQALLRAKADGKNRVVLARG